jgi:Ca2+-binding EF-hand superfamily protein
MMLVIATYCLSGVLGTRVNFVERGSAGFWKGAISSQQLRNRHRARESLMASDSTSKALEALLRRLSLKDDVEKAATDLFRMIDGNTDGQISMHEMKTAYYKMKSPEQMKIWNMLKLNTFKTCMEVIGDADIDGDGKISIEEFKTFLSQVEDEENAQSSDDTLSDEAHFAMLNLFGSLDRDGDGQLSMRELRASASRSSIFRNKFNFSDSSAFDSFMKDADINSDGILTFDEFKSYLVSSCADEFSEYMDIVSDPSYKRQYYKEIGVNVVILREVDGELQVLVQQHPSRGLTTIGGEREKDDSSSMSTALRKIAEIGLLDVACIYKDVPQSFLRDFEIPRPRFLKLFGETPKRDWWMLLLDGPGVFKETAAKAEATSEDATSLVIPDGSVKADCLGHVWIPVKNLNMLSDSIAQDGRFRIFQAAAAAIRAKKLKSEQYEFESPIDEGVALRLKQAR